MEERIDVTTIGEKGPIYIESGPVFLPPDTPYSVRVKESILKNARSEPLPKLGDI